ncbi:DUF6443 domain-containing protein [Flavobacterium sp. GCM10023249]|uniref:DUF6443 domain-containing protein n=1 Tax=unclassified Flavobacterium TaxID=196869 RepID=UPI00361C2A37
MHTKLKNKFIYTAFLILNCYIGFGQETSKIDPTARIVDPGDGDCVTKYIDDDMDGWGSAERACVPIDAILGYSTKTGDCDDFDPNINIPKYWYLDDDQDGYGGNVRTSIKTCLPPPNHVATSLDCNDLDNTIGGPIFWYLDIDNDGFGSIPTQTKLCTPPVGNYVKLNGDCNDDEPSINPNTLWYADTDNDGYGDPASTPIKQCNRPIGYTNNNLDACPSECAPQTKNGCFSFSNENYIYTRTFNKPVSDTSLPLAKNDFVGSITYFDGLGREKQSIAIGQGGENKSTDNLISWENSWVIGNSTIPTFNVNGTVNENRRINGINPFDETAIIWECGSDNGPNTDPDGGWNTSNITIDKNVPYRYSVWVKRTGSNDGLSHHGTSNVLNLDGSTNTNPYFWYGDLPQLDTWYLMVGYIHPASYTGGYSGISGVYDTKGNKVIDGTDFKWNTTSSVTYFRSYFYYATDLNTKQYFYNPIVQKINANSPPLAVIASDFNPGDIVTHAEYDRLGRQARVYLPYNINKVLNGKIYIDPLTDLNSFYNTSKYENTLNPYSEKLYDDSPLNRVLEQGQPGDAWKTVQGSDLDNTVKFLSQFNTDADKIKIYNVTTASIPQDGGYYTANSLYKNIIKNENWKPTQTHLDDNTTIEFKDKLDRLILKRTHEKGKWHDTYYVYDDIGNLSYVLPPLVNTYPTEQQIWPDQYYEDYNITSPFTPGYTNNSGNEVAVTLYNNRLSGYFDNYGDGPNVPLNSTTPAIDLNFNPPLPDMQLGTVYTNGIQTPSGYTAYIKNGDIYFTGSSATINSGVYFHFDIDLGTLSTNLGITISQQTIDELAYQYKYDERQRIVEKKLPGKGWEYFIYDSLDRPILVQDAELRTKNKWLFTKYDTFNRIAYTGIWTNPVSGQNRLAVLNLINTQSNPVWNETKQPVAQNIGTQNTAVAVQYSNNVFPKTNDELEVLAINYYDDYNFDLSGMNPEDSFGLLPSDNVRTLTTGTKIRTQGTNLWTTKVTYYNQKAQPIFTASNNTYLSAIDKLKSKLDFTGKILETETVHTKGSNSILIRDFFSYDHTGRMLKHTQQINNQPEQLIVKNTYDQLGKLVSKNIGGKTPTVGEKGLQKVDFDYNIRGWMKNINDITNMGNDLFSLNLNYQEQTAPNNYVGAPGQPLYNGNISSTSWKTNNESSSLKSYYHSYDNLNRLTNSVSLDRSLLNNAYIEVLNTYNENVGKYDRNGNILTMSRFSHNPSNPLYGKGIDYLNYTYKGNKLMGVNDAYGLSPDGSEGFKDGNTVGDDFSYDFNGNIIVDNNKKITNITYNHLNLPVKIVFDNADTNSANPKVIEFTYDASGIKLAKTVWEPKTINGVVQNTLIQTQYAGNFIYEKNSTGATPVLQFFSHPEGYVTYNAGNYKYVFQYKDHLGNVRLSYADNDDNGSITGATTEIFFDDFESASGWDNTGFSWGSPISGYDSTKKRSGNLSGKVENLVAGVKAVHNNNWIAINNTQPTDYIFSGWIYSNGPIAQMFLFENTATETNYYTNVEYIRSNEKNRWVYVEKRVTVPANITKLNLRIDNTNGNGAVWFDNVSIRRVNATNEIVEENNYYPFGMKHKGYNNIISGNGNPLANKYKYNGKEFQDELGLNFYDHGARNYDPAIGRWLNIDALAEKMTQWSPYNFCFDNPIKFVDPDGNAPFDEWRQLKDGSFEWLSDLGRKDGIDFIHYTQGEHKGQTLITDNEGNEQWTSSGSDVLNGFERRSNSIGFMDVFNEFKKGYGPKRSLFNSNHPMTVDMKDSYAAFLGRNLYMTNGGKKGYVGYNFGISGIFKSKFDMTEQMVGSCGVSIYPIGGKVVFMLTDTKTPTSLFYHLPGLSSRYNRDSNPTGILMPYAETKQTYIWVESVNTLKTMYKKESNDIQSRQNAMSTGL